MLRSQLIALGYTDDEIRRTCGSRRLVSVRRGADVEPGDERLLRPEDRHALAVRAAVGQLGPASVVSHASAAVLHGIALWDVPLDRVHVSRPGTSGGRRSGQLHLHVSPMEPDEVVTVDGIAAAARVLAFADRRAESPGGGAQRVAMRRAGLPMPELQVMRCSAAGVRPGRVDFWWPEHGVIGEFDGLVEYGRLLRPGQTAGEVIVAEKVREDALRETARGMVRWTWAEIRPFDGAERKLRRVLGLV